MWNLQVVEFESRCNRGGICK